MAIRQVIADRYYLKYYCPLCFSRTRLLIFLPDMGECSLDYIHTSETPATLRTAQGGSVIRMALRLVFPLQQDGSASLKGCLPVSADKVHRVELVKEIGDTHEVVCHQRSGKSAMQQVADSRCFYNALKERGLVAHSARSTMSSSFTRQLKEGATATFKTVPLCVLR